MRPATRTRSVASAKRSASAAARHAFHGGHHSRAWKLARRAIGQRPRDPAVLQTGIMVAYGRGDLGEASRLLERCLEIAPDDAETLHWEVLISISRRDFDRARRAAVARVAALPGQPAALELLAEIEYRQGDFAGAYRRYRTLVFEGYRGGIALARVTRALAHLCETAPPATLAVDLDRLLSLDEVNHDELARVASRHFESCLENSGLPAADAMEAQPGLLRLIERTFVVVPGLERRLLDARRELLLAALSGESLAPSRIAVVRALALHAFHCEYAGFEADDEREMVALLDDHLGELAASADPIAPAFEVAMLVLAMFRPLDEAKAADHLAAHPADAWSSRARAVVEATLLEVRRQRRAADDVPALVPVEDATSNRVRAQYESNPYPRWRWLPPVEPVSCWEAVRADAIGFEPPASMLSAPVEVLIAGCGTGREALALALGRHDARVTAIDLSRRSLAYAEEMADRLGAGNVEFFHGDILELDRLGRRFDVIHSSGVLHHMADPARGLACLRRRLAPGGALRIGLYSEAARRHITRARKLIECLGYRGTLEDIRRFRAGVMTGSGDFDLDKLLESRDFYSASSCRDLLFHVQEHQFTIDGIARMLDALGLRFLGFVDVPPIAASLYRGWYPDDPALNSLEGWARVEAAIPDTFRQMYQFWCVERAD